MAIHCVCVCVCVCAQRVVLLFGVDEGYLVFQCESSLVSLQSMDGWQQLMLLLCVCKACCICVAPLWERRTIYPPCL